MCGAAKELKLKGAKKVYAFASHSQFSDSAYERIEKSQIERVITTNTIPMKKNVPIGKIVQVSVCILHLTYSYSIS